MDAEADEIDCVQISFERVNPDYILPGYDFLASILFHAHPGELHRIAIVKNRKECAPLRDTGRILSFNNSLKKGF